MICESLTICSRMPRLTWFVVHCAASVRVIAMLVAPYATSGVRNRCIGGRSPPYNPPVALAGGPLEMTASEPIGNPASGVQLLRDTGLAACRRGAFRPIHARGHPRGVGQIARPLLALLLERSRRLAHRFHTAERGQLVGVDLHPGTAVRELGSDLFRR